MKEQPVVGSASALAFLFAGGHNLNVAPQLDRAARLARRKAIFQGWSRCVMAHLPHPLAIARAREERPAPQDRVSFPQGDDHPDEPHEVGVSLP